MSKTMWEKLKHWFLDMSIGIKIPLVGCLILLISLIFTLGWDRIIARRTVSGYMADISEKKNALVGQRVQQMMENAEDMSALIFYNDNVQSYLPITDVRRQMETEYSMQYFIQYVLENSVGISNIILYRASGGMITSNYINASQLDESRFASRFDDMKDLGNQVDWQDMHDNNYHIFPDERAAITLYRNIISLYTGERIGMLVLNINEYNIAKCYQDEIDDYTKIYIIDSEERIISSKNRDLLYQPLSSLGSFASDRFIDENGADYLVSRADIGYMGWTLIRLDDYRAAMSAFTISTWQYAVFTAALMIIMAALSFLFTRRIIAPVLRLSRIMESSEEEVLLGGDVRHTSRDEVGRLTESFGNMQRRIGVLIERIRFEQKQKSRLEMLSLQTQIKPHFLYNTLESVCALIQMDRNDDAIKMLKSIESFYRGSLSCGHFLITVAEEIEITRQYVNIQSFRYFGKLEFYCYISRDVEDCLIPKLSLQPFVENAIYHGLGNGGRDGRIEIRERHDDSTIMITVSDNGAGFNLDKPKNKTGDGHGYGVSNVQSSIQSCFGAEYGVHIVSKPAEGTKVFIRIPIKRVRGEGDRG